MRAGVASLVMTLLTIQAAAMGVPAADVPDETVAPAAGHVDETVTVASVQFRVAVETYLSIDAFARAVEAHVADAVENHSADIVVFPEYLNAFLIATEFAEVIRDAATVEEALQLIAAKVGEQPDLPALIRNRADASAAAAMEIWTEIAKAYDVSIVPGTFFVYDDADGREAVRNRLVVIDNTGSVTYEQDKVFLTEEEFFDLGLKPGRLQDAEPTEVAGLAIGFTICRDTYFDEWEEILDGSDLWIDLRANGEPYTHEVESRFGHTLPQRVRRTEAVAGVNSTLTGEFLDFHFEGPSYVVDENGDRIAASRTVTGPEITTIELVRRDESWEVRRE